jgi:hypothetical protein
MNHYASGWITNSEIIIAESRRARIKLLCKLCASAVY